MQLEGQEFKLSFIHREIHMSDEHLVYKGVYKGVPQSMLYSFHNRCTLKALYFKMMLRTAPAVDMEVIRLTQVLVL